MSAEVLLAFSSWDIRHFDEHVNIDMEDGVGLADRTLSVYGVFQGLNNM